MPRRFSIKTTLTRCGLTFTGLRGWAGKPTLPPLANIPIVAYLLVEMLDVASYVFGPGSESGRARSLALTYVLVAGAAISLLTATTGLWDWLRSTEPGTHARRTANGHMTVMLVVTAVVLADLVVRLVHADHASTSGVVLGLSLGAGVLVAFGTMFGGSLVSSTDATSSTPAITRPGTGPESIACSRATERVSVGLLRLRSVGAGPRARIPQPSPRTRPSR